MGNSDPKKMVWGSPPHSMHLGAHKGQWQAYILQQEKGKKQCRHHTPHSPVPAAPMFRGEDLWLLYKVTVNSGKSPFKFPTQRFAQQYCKK